MRYSERGFTLIELSIVLVIIGLIVGGVLVGQNLIAAAAGRAQISQIEKYNAAVNTFRGKYGYLPGDIPNSAAVQFGFAARGLYKGEGDGNGLIEENEYNSNYAYGIIGWGPFQGEEAMFWVDLTTANGLNVNMIDGSFSTATPTTVINTTINGAAIGKYFPQAKIGGSNAYVYVWSGGWNELWNGSPGDSYNYFAVSGIGGTASGYDGTLGEFSIMTPAQAYAIDKKMDDGLPQTGNVQAIGSSMWWAAGGPISGYGGIQSASYNGDYSQANTSGGGGPVTLTTDIGDGIGVSPSPYTCYDGTQTPALPEKYSLLGSNANLNNCVLSFRFQ